MTDPEGKAGIFLRIKVRFVLIKFCIRVAKKTYREIMYAMNDKDGDGTLTIDNGENMLTIHKGEATIKDIRGE